MADLEERLEAFVKLGSFLREFCEIFNNPEENLTKNPWTEELQKTTSAANHQNGWFTKENVLFSLARWGEVLTEERLRTWLASYDLSQTKNKTVALIMAGNIPMVGFHDFLTTLLTGNRALVKLSSNDTALLPFMASYLSAATPALHDKVSFSEGKLNNFDAVIATGSNNTARYFAYYFGKKPHIIRKNRSSVAVLTGKESSQQLTALGEDIFRYYGLGCRSVSKLFVPKDYDFTPFFKAIYSYSSIIDQHKYANNYDYNKAVYLMSEFNILENGFLMLKEDSGYASPIATLFYEYYDDVEGLHKKLEEDRDQLQCIVAADLMPGEVPFGRTQYPELSDYADRVDTVEFLLKT